MGLFTSVTNQGRANIGSTAADNAVTIAGNSSVVISGNSTAIIQGNSTALVSQAAIGWGRTGFGSISVQLSSAGDNTVVSSAAGQSVYVYGWSVTPLTTAAQLVRFLDGSTSEIWRSRIQGGSTATANFIISELAVSPPSYLCKTSAGNALLVNLTSSGVNMALAYWRE